jgi:hypothetical protein
LKKLGTCKILSDFLESVHYFRSADFSTKNDCSNGNEDLKSFFQNNLNVFENLPLSDGMTIYYSAKDIPFFYTLSDSICFPVLKYMYG